MFKKLKGRMAENRKKNKNMGLIPKINNIEDAVEVSKQGVQASIFVAACTTIVMLISVNYTPIYDISYLATIDIVAFMAIAFGIKKMSRTVSVIGLCLYLYEQYWAMIYVKNGAKSLVVFFVALAYVNSIRGTFAYHKYKKQEDQSEQEAV